MSEFQNVLENEDFPLCHLCVVNLCSQFEVIQQLRYAIESATVNHINIKPASDKERGINNKLTFSALSVRNVMPILIKEGLSRIGEMRLLMHAFRSDTPTSVEATSCCK